MLKREVVDGRKATLAYIKKNFEPCDPDEADLIKIMFDDGEIVFVAAADEPVEQD